MAPTRVLVVGGGIGGLATALALHRVGIPARVFEGVAELRPLGVGINLLPHSVRVLADLGLLSGLTSVGIETSALSYYNKFGQQIWSEPRGVLAGYHLPQISIHRGELQMLLLRAVLDRLGPRAVTAGHRLVRADLAGRKVRATFAGQAQPEEADVLIGADGIHSVVRRQFYPDEGPPRYSGRLLWRAVTESAPYLDGRTMIMAGHQNQKFVCYPISRSHFEAGRSLVNWIAELTEPGQTPPRQDWSREVPAERFAAPFAGWRFGWLDVPDLIARAEAIYEYPMVDRDPLPTWSFGGITLLGDAENGGVYWAFVSTVRSDDELYSVGMHILGFRDVIIPSTGNDEYDYRSLHSFLGFTAFSGATIRDGDMVGDPVLPTYRAHMQPEDRFSADTPMFNRYGRWRLVPIDGQRN